MRDLYLSIFIAELFGSRHKEKNVLAKGTIFSWFRVEKRIWPIYSQDGELVYYQDINGLENENIYILNMALGKRDFSLTRRNEI